MRWHLSDMNVKNVKNVTGTWEIETFAYREMDERTLVTRTPGTKSPLWGFIAAPIIPQYKYSLLMYVKTESSADFFYD